mmetsp:Transcript_95475/g.308129  ORF Transcript_95475/g.308129 Transcript_95475/m.308129 type:complete len:215 (+) Transcript_95475:479-1123(+)
MERLRGTGSDSHKGLLRQVQRGGAARDGYRSPSRAAGACPHAPLCLASLLPCLGLGECCRSGMGLPCGQGRGGAPLQLSRCQGNSCGSSRGVGSMGGSRGVAGTAGRPSPRRVAPARRRPRRSSRVCPLARLDPLVAPGRQWPSTLNRWREGRCFGGGSGRSGFGLRPPTSSAPSATAGASTKATAGHAPAAVPALVPVTSTDAEPRGQLAAGA